MTGKKIKPLDSIEIKINRQSFVKRLFCFVLATEVLLILLDIFVSHHEGSSHGAIRRLFNITREDSIGTWFSSTQAILVGCVLFLIAITVKKTPSESGNKKYYSWMVLGAFFTFIGIDDAVKFHERMGTVFKNIMKAAPNGASESSGVLDTFPSYSWQLLFGPFFFVMGLFILIFLLKELKTRQGKLLLLSALSLFSIAVFFDFLEGMDGPHDQLAFMLDIKASHIRHYSKAIEEFFEMLGTSLFLVLFTDYLLLRVRRWSILVN